MNTENKKSEMWQHLRAARKYADLTQLQVAKAMSVTRNAVTHWESESGIGRVYPKMDTLKRLSEELYRVPLAFLIDDNVSPNDLWKYVARPADGGPLPHEPAAQPVQTTPSLEAVAQSQQASRHTLLAAAFWSSVRFNVLARSATADDPPEFDFVAQHKTGGLTPVSARKGRSLIAFSPLEAGETPADVLQREGSRLLWAEKTLGKPHNKHLLLFAAAEALHDFDLARAEATYGIQVHAFDDPTKAADWLLTL